MPRLAPPGAALLLALSASTVACAAGPTAPPALTGSRAVLFIGNSLTYTNGLPTMMQAVGQQAGDTTLAVAMVANPDFSLSDHFLQGTTNDWFRRRPWAYVVLQQGSSALPESQLHLRTWTQRFAPIIRAAGAEPVLFMVWPQSTRLFDFPNVADSYRNAALAVEGIFAPSGEAWVAYARSIGGQGIPTATAYGALYLDGLHPTALGSYLSAIVLLERITGIAPLTLPAIIPGVPAQPTVVRALQQAATQALAANARYPHQVLQSTPTQERPRGSEEVDSARIARQAYQDAQASTTPERAAALLQRATAAWPSQPAYWLERARVGIRTDDITSVNTAVNALVRLQQSPGLLRDSLLRGWIARRATPELPERVTRAAAPVRTATLFATVDSTVFVEGADVSPRTSALFVTSLRRGTVLHCVAGTPWRDLDLARDPRMQAVFAVRVAPDDSTLWVTSAPHALRHTATQVTATTTATAAIARVRVANGAVLEWHALPSPHAAHLPGDLLALPNGDVLVSDSETARLYLWRAAAGSWSTISHPGFRSPQGVALLPSGRQVAIADYSHGLYLLALDSLTVRRIDVASGTSVLGLDGLAWHHDRLYAVQNGAVVPQLVALELTADYTAVRALRVVDRQPELAPAPSSVISSTHRLLYVGNSPWSLFDAAGVRTGEAAPPFSAVLAVPDRARAERGSRNVATTPVLRSASSVASPARRSPASISAPSCTRSSASLP